MTVAGVVFALLVAPFLAAGTSAASDPGRSPGAASAAARTTTIAPDATTNNNTINNSTSTSTSTTNTSDDDGGFWQGALTVATELDTNPRRVVTVVAEDAEPPQADDIQIVDETPAALSDSERLPPDGLLRLAAELHLRGGASDAAPAPWRWQVDAAAGAKLFRDSPSEHMAVGQLAGGVIMPVGVTSAVVARAFSKTRAQASGARSYQLGRVELGGQWAVTDALPWPLIIGVGGVGGTFIALDEPLFSSTTTGLLLTSQVRVGRERIELAAETDVRASPFAPAVKGGLPDTSRRLDLPLQLTVAVTSPRALYLRASGSVVRNLSNSEGEAFTRWRGVVVAGTRLPWELTATGQLALQITRYDDGISLGQRYFLASDDETQNVVDGTLSRPIADWLTVEARLAWYTNELNVEAVTYGRLTGSVGLRALFR